MNNCRVSSVFVFHYYFNKDNVRIEIPLKTDPIQPAHNSAVVYANLSKVKVQIIHFQRKSVLFASSITKLQTKNR